MSDPARGWLGRAFAIVVFAWWAVAPARAAMPEAQLRDLLAAHAWADAVRLCDALPESESHRPDRKDVMASHFAEVSALCAAAASGAGDQKSADWWWFTATAMDVPTATRVLAEVRAVGLLTTLAPPRALAHPEVIAFDRANANRVTLADGTTVAGSAAEVVERMKPPKWMFPQLVKAPHTEMSFEMVIDAQGNARQPLVVAVKAPPLYGFQALWLIGHWRFAPAHLNGEAVESIFQVTLTTNRS